MIAGDMQFQTDVGIRVCSKYIWSFAIDIGLDQ